MKHFPSLLFLLLIVCLGADAQPDLKHSFFINYKKCFGYKVHFDVIMPHSNGSLFALREVKEPTYDCRLYKLDANTFDTLWSVKYGGSEEDFLSNMIELPDQTMVLAGTTNSNDGDVPYGHTYTAKEIWVLRVDTLGNILNGTTFGGSDGSVIYTLRYAPEGYIYLAGNTNADDYDFLHAGFGSFDADPWIVRLDTNLSLKKVLVVPGNDNETRPFMEYMGPNSVIMGFGSSGTNPEVYGNLSFGLHDLVVMHLDSNFNIKWGKRIGGNLDDGAEGICLKYTDTKFCIVGSTRSCSGDISFKRDCNGTTSSMLIAIMDTNGLVHHCKAYGDSNTANWAAPPTLVVSGAYLHEGKIYAHYYTQGEAGDMDMNLSPKRRAAAWVGAFDSTANLIGKNTFDGGGDTYIKINNIFISKGKKILNFEAITDSLHSFSCDTSKYFGGILQITEVPLDLQESIKPNLIKIFPNPAHNEILISLSPALRKSPCVFNIHNMQGQKMFSKKINQPKEMEAFNIEKLPIGQYLLHTQNEKEDFFHIFYKN